MPTKNLDLTFITHDPNDRHYTTAARSHNARMRGKHLNVNELSLSTANQAKQSKAFVFRTQVKGKCTHGNAKVEKPCGKCQNAKKKAVKKKEARPSDKEAEKSTVVKDEPEATDTDMLDDMLDAELEEVVPSHSSPPDNGTLADPRMNHRSSFPLALSKDDAWLINVWLTVAPKIFCLPQKDHDPGSIKDPRSVFFPLAMSSEAAFRSIVLLPAALWNNTGSDNIHYQQAQAFRLIHNIQGRLYEYGTLDPQDYVAFPALYNWQRWHGDEHGAQVIAESHFQALEWRLQHGIEPPGKEGMLAVEWFNLMSSTHPQQLPLNTQNEHSARFLKGLFEDLTTSLKSIQELARKHTIFARDAGLTRRLELFQPHTRLYKILTSLPNGDEDQSSTTWSIYFLRICQFKILLYIHLGLLSLSDDDSAMEDFLATLDDAVLGCESSNPQDAIIFLLWIMINNSTLSTPETSHQVIVAMIPHIASRFRRWHALSRYLMEWLRIRDRTADDQAGCVYPFQEINMDELEAVIWHEMGWDRGFADAGSITSPTMANSFVYQGVESEFVDAGLGEDVWASPESRAFSSTLGRSPEFIFQEAGTSF